MAAAPPIPMRCHRIFLAAIKKKYFHARKNAVGKLKTIPVIPCASTLIPGRIIPNKVASCELGSMSATLRKRKTRSEARKFTVARR